MAHNQDQWMSVVIAVLSIVMVVGIWKAFKKAGQPGWASIVPIYNCVTLLRVAQRPLWYLILMFIPLANIYAHFSICNGLSKNFGKGTGFTVGLAFFPYVFFPILGLGNATYSGQEPIQAPVPRQPVSSADIDKIAKLHELKKSGALTEEEFQAQKAKLVA